VRAGLQRAVRSKVLCLMSEHFVIVSIVTHSRPLRKSVFLSLKFENTCGAKEVFL
jgi:hypothetical protein